MTTDEKDREIQRLMDLGSRFIWTRYNVRTLEPYGIMEGRVNKLRKDYYEFLDGRYFLDIGSAQGRHSILFAEKAEVVTSLEPVIDSRLIHLYTLQRHNIVNNLVQRQTFNSFYSEDYLYDRIYIGNCIHNLFIDDGCTWTFVEKLARIATDLVLFEGPRCSECKSIRRKKAIADNLKKFSYKDFMTEVKKYFTVESREKTFYDKEREFLLLRKK